MKEVEVIIETPRGSAQKYNYDPQTNFFKLKKNLPTGMVFPYDFGFIPNTKGEDGDPLDVLVISEFQSFPGCVMSCRIIGCIKAKQTESKNEQGKIRNDRFIAIPVQSLVFEKVIDVKDLPKKFMDELKQFFVSYNQLEGKKFEPIAISNSTSSIKMIRYDNG
ncbi:MAG: Inorganic pyrophosphatase [Ferruginibacter sp.]|nr:Inorganic pyrophosphatase [Ferruginibacter sp.]